MKRQPIVFAILITAGVFLASYKQKNTDQQTGEPQENIV